MVMSNESRCHDDHDEESGGKAKWLVVWAGGQFFVLFFCFDRRNPGMSNIAKE